MDGIKFVYVAGPLSPRGSGNHAIEYLKNVRAMIAAGKILLDNGLVPFVPALDMLFFITGEYGDRVPTDSEIKAFSMAWLSKCNALVTLPRWETSPGTLAEIEFAHQNGIWVYHSIGALLNDIKLKEVGL